MRKRSKLANWMGGSILFLLITLTLIYVFSGPIIRYAMAPASSFADTVHPAAPDYAESENWAALPDRDDMADLVVADDPDDPLLNDRQKSAAADVFYVHPTTFLLNINWNQPLDHTLTNLITDEGVIRNQASAFNACCRVYAPRYRQATLYSFQAEGDDGIKALELAYKDVKAAFEYYLENYNEGRPFIIAAHSQGSLHSLRLLEEEAFKSIISDQLIAAYTIGMGMPLDKLTGINDGVTACKSADDIGCLISWNSIGMDVTGERWTNTRLPYAGKWVVRDDVPINCINPISWTTDESVAPASAHGGAVWFNASNNKPPGIDPNVVSAQCKDGLLRISQPTVSTYTLVLVGEQDYHAYDYSLFYMDIRKNALDRVNAWFGSNQN